MEELEKDKEHLFDENTENIVIKYKFLRGLIIKHYNRGCKYLNIVKILCAVFFVAFVGIGIAACANGASKTLWLTLWIILIFLDVGIFLITDYCKYLISSKVIPYLEDDSQVEFGEYSIFEDDDDAENEDDEEENND